MKPTLTRDLVLFGFLALAVRAAFLVWSISRFGVDQFSDFLYMHEIGCSLSEGTGFAINGTRIFNQSPGYPYLLGLLYKATGCRELVALGMNALMGSVAVVFVYLTAWILGERLSMQDADRKLSAGCAGLMACLFPDSILHCAFLSSENLLVMILSVFVYLVLTLKRKPAVQAVVTGILGYAAVSVKAYVFPVLAVVPLLYMPLRRQWFSRTGLFLSVMLLCSLPWIVKNYRDSGGRFIPFAAVAGEVMLDGTNPDADGRPTNNYHLDPAVESGMHPVDLDRARMQKAIMYAKADLPWFAGLTLKKFVLSFSPVRDYLFEENGRPRFVNRFFSRWVASLVSLLVMTGAVLGIWLVRKNKQLLTLGLIIAGSPVLIQTMFFAYPRYRFPFLFILLPFAGIASAYLCRLAMNSCRKSHAEKQI